MVQLVLKVSLFLLEKKSHGIQMRAQQKQGLRFVLVTPVLPAALPLMMGLMETSTASMGDQLEDMAHLALALPATLASVVQTVLPTPVLPPPHHLMMGRMGTSTASMGETLEVGGTTMAHLALALPATLALLVQTVLSVQQAIVDHLPFALLILV